MAKSLIQSTPLKLQDDVRDAAGMFTRAGYFKVQMLLESVTYKEILSNVSKNVGFNATPIGLKLRNE